MSLVSPFILFSFMTPFLVVTCKKCFHCLFGVLKKKFHPLFFLFHVLTSFCSLFCISFSTGTSKRWFPFRPSRTESCRSCTDSSVPSKTKGRVYLPPCPEPLLSPWDLLSSLLVGPGQPKSSSGPGLTLTWITTAYHTLVHTFIHSFSLTFFWLLALCVTVSCLSCLGIQQSSSFSGGEQRLPLYCNPEHCSSLPAKRGTVCHRYIETTQNLMTISCMMHALIFPQITVL